GEGSELIERLAGGEIVLEEIAPKTVVVESQPAIATFAQQAVVEERGDGAESVLGPQQPGQHLGLVTAGASGPLEVGGNVLVGVGARDQTECGAGAGGVGLLVSAVLLEELPEVSGGEGMVLFVVSAASAVQEQGRGLILRRLRGEGRGEDHSENEGEEPRSRI